MRFPILVLFFVIACPETFAQERTLPSGADARQDEQQAMSPETLKQKASYLIGYDWVKTMKLQGIEFEMKELVKGISDAAAGKLPPMTDEEIQSVLIAFRRSLEQKQQEQLAKLADENMRKGTAFLKANRLKEGVKELENGLQYQVLKTGAGETPRITDNVKVHYKGMFTDGTVFETTAGSQPVSLTVGGGLRGISNALQKMKVGDRWKLFLPANLAFGAVGDGASVGPNQVLIYELELVEIIR